VLNILGGESSEVTPVGHEYSGGNVVFGTSPGRRGQVLETRIGSIPVYNNVREGLADGHRFNCGVVYLPPLGCARRRRRADPGQSGDCQDLHRHREDPGARCPRDPRDGTGERHRCLRRQLPWVADAWNKVRIGGALGGDTPGEALRKGSIAIFSNSGNFTTTIATYLRMAGWGTTTLISSARMSTSTTLRRSSPSHSRTMPEARLRSVCGTGRLL
jgi:hypothetical protein